MDILGETSHTSGGQHRHADGNRNWYPLFPIVRAVGISTDNRPRVWLSGSQLVFDTLLPANLRRFAKSRDLPEDGHQ